MGGTLPSYRLVSSTTILQVGQLLMGVPQVTVGNTDSLQSAMEFEFSNSDLETGTDFSIDHPSVFDSIAEPDLDERGDNFLFNDKRGDNHFLFSDKRGDNHFLFNDNSIFDAAQKQSPAQELKIHNSSGVRDKSLNLTQEGHLNLQIIPLNNLKVVSAIKTSDGIQYIALPQQTEIQSTKISPTLLVSNIPVSSSQYSGVENTLTLSLEGRHCMPTGNYGSGITRDNVITADNNVQPANIIHIEELQDLDGLSFVSQVDNANFFLSGNTVSNLDESVFPPILNSDYAISDVNQASLLSEAGDTLFESSTGVVTKDASIHSESSLSVGSVAPKPKHMISLLSSPMVDKLIQDSLETQRSRKDVSIKFQIETETGMRAISTEALPKIKLFNGHSRRGPNKERTPLQKELEQKSKVDSGNSVQSEENSSVGPPADTNSNTDISDSETILADSEILAKMDTNCAERVSAFICEICNANFKAEGYYRRHMDLHESRSDYLPDIDVSTPILDMPDIETNSVNESHFVTNKSANEKQETIREVSMTKVNSKQEMENMSREIVTDLCSSLTCDVCSATFTKIGNLRRHKLIHEAKSQDNYRFECNSCYRKFLQKCDLKRHQLIHSKDLPYLCTKCGKGYIRKSDLVVHERFHSQERGFKCPHCIKSYTQSSDLHRHVRQIHEPQSGLLCPHCTSSFTKSASLDRHVRAKHPHWHNLHRSAELLLVDGENMPTLTDIDIIDHLTEGV